MQQLVILLEINCSSTCFGRLYAHHQEVRLHFTACGFLSCSSCCDVGESGGKLCAVNIRISYQDILFLLEILYSLNSDYNYLHFLNYGAVQFGRYLPFLMEGSSTFLWNIRGVRLDNMLLHPRRLNLFLFFLSSTVNP
jgi:hypothetical protein